MEKLSWDEFLPVTFQDWEQHIAREFKTDSLKHLELHYAPHQYFFPLQADVPALALEKQSLFFWTKVMVHPEMQLNVADLMEISELEHFVLSDGHETSNYSTNLAEDENTSWQLPVWGHTYFDAGFSAVNELALLVLELSKKPSTSLVTLGMGDSFFVDVAKALAMRILLKELETYHNHLISPQIVGVSGLRNKTQRAVHVNLLRGMTEQQAAYLGMCDGFLSLPHSYLVTADRKVHQKALRLALNQNRLLGFESHFFDVLNPVEASPMITQFAIELAQVAWEKAMSFQESYELHGLHAAVFKDVLKEDRDFFKEQWTKEKSLVGSSVFIHEEDKKLELRTLPIHLESVDFPFSYFNLELELEADKKTFL